MRRAKAMALLLAYLVVLALSGCGSIHKVKGSVFGQVLDAQGKPIAQAMVIVEGQGLTSHTDSSGLYRINNVPVGTHKITATKTGYQSAASASGLTGYSLTVSDGALELKKDNKPVPLRESLQQMSASSGEEAFGSIVVTVKQGVSVMVDPIVLIPQTANVNNLVIYQAEPSPMGAPLIIGNEINMQYDIAYKTNKAAKLALFAYYETGGDNYLVKQWEQQVQPGSGERILGGSLTIPELFYIDVMAALMTSDNQVLAISTIQPYAVGGGTQPRAPFLYIDAIDKGGVKLSWKGGNTANFMKFEIHRNNISLTEINHQATNSYIDTAPLEGLSTEYKLIMKTTDRMYESNPIAITVRRPGFNKVTLNKAYSSAVVDPTRGYLYFANEFVNSISVLSKDGREIDSIPVCAVPRNMAIHPDGSTLAIACSDAVAIVNLDTFTVQRIIYNVNPGTIVFRPKSRFVYACDYSKGIWEIDVDTGTAELRLPSYTYMRNASFSPDGGKMYFSSAGSIVAVDMTRNYAKIATFVLDQHYQGAIPDPSGDVVYIDNASYSTTTTIKKNDYGRFYIRGVNKDGTLLFGDSGTVLLAYTRQGESLTPAVELGSGTYDNIQAMNVTDENELVVVIGHSNTTDLLIVDIDARTQAEVF